MCHDDGLGEDCVNVCEYPLLLEMFRLSICPSLNATTVSHSGNCDHACMKSGI